MHTDRDIHSYYIKTQSDFFVVSLKNAVAIRCVDFIVMYHILKKAGLGELWVWLCVGMRRNRKASVRGH